MGNISMEETLCAYRLSITDGVGSRSAMALYAYAGCFGAVWTLSGEEIAARTSLKPGIICALQNAPSVDDTKRRYEEMLKAGIAFYEYRHPLYPSRLYDIYDPPMGIYVIGRLPDPTLPAISIVGARNCSEYGRYVTRKLSSALASNGFQIISGMARGVDGIAEQAALTAGGYSLGVLGCGVDVCYPPDNRALYNDLIASAGVMSEYPPGTQPNSGQFPVRNRIISALSDAVIVIEARDRSGSLITADIALEQGKDVYALPGRVTDALSHGCNRLIKQGAGIILSPGELIEDLRLDYQVTAGAKKDRKTSDEYGNDAAAQMSLIDTAGFGGDEKILMSKMEITPKSVQKLQAETSLEPGRLFGALTKLTIKGYILQTGSCYSIVKR